MSLTRYLKQKKFNTFVYGDLANGSIYSFVTLGNYDRNMLKVITDFVAVRTENR